MFHVRNAMSLLSACLYCLMAWQSSELPVCKSEWHLQRLHAQAARCELAGSMTQVQVK